MRTAATQLEAVAAVKVGRVLLVGAHLCVKLRRQVVFNAQRPLAHRPVVPNAASPVTDLRTAERKVLEVAREAVEVFTLTETAEFDVELLIEKLLLIPHLRQTGRLTAAPDFLSRRKAAHARVVNAVIADVVAAAVRHGQLKLCVFPAQNFLQIKVRPQAELIAVTRCAVMVIATVQV